MRVRRWILWVVLALPFGLPGGGIAQVDDAPSLAGVIDIHAHAAPETSMLNFKRAFDAIEAAQIARIYGMRGIVLKEHTTETASWAYLVSQMVPGVEVFGGIVLNKAVGGLNPVAVEAMALSRGNRGRVVYMPTVDARPSVFPTRRTRSQSRATDNCCRKRWRCSRSSRSMISACPPGTSVPRRH
jgi:hypothetical protein